jgi:diguanylate cyclase (GGDEF)-like protein
MTEVFRTLNATSTEPTETTAELAILQIRSVHLPPSSTLIRRDGLEIPIEDSIAAIHDRQGQAIGAVIVFRDVSVARAMAQQITHSAEHDFLTGLPNRMLLNDRISQAIASARRHTRHLAALFLDLDGFKHINDSLGHPIGDKLLQSVANRLPAYVRGADTVSRQGGDEFVVLLPDLQQPEDAAVMAGRILRDVAEPHLVDQHEMHVTTSIGVSVFPDVDTSQSRADPAGAVHSNSGGLRSYCADRPMGAASSRPAGAGVGECRPASDDDGCQRVGDGVSGRRLLEGFVCDPRRITLGSASARIRADGKCSHEASRQHRSHPANSAEKRRASGDR